MLLDLGSHEIDILNYLTETCPKILYSHISYISNKNNEDYAYLSLKYAHTQCHIETSWVPNYKTRLLSIFGSDKFYVLDYALQKIRSSRASPRVKMENPDWNDFLGISRNIEEEVPITIKEPAKLQLNHFIESVKKGEVMDPMCTGQDALKVLRVVERARRVESVRKIYEELTIFNK